MSFKVPAARALKGGGVAFRTDAKCSDGYVVVGGWETTQAPSAARWFSLRITPEDAPYLFDSGGKSQWASASAELLGTLVALWAFGHFKKGSCRRSLVVELRAETDNRGNEALLAVLVFTQVCLFGNSFPLDHSWCISSYWPKKAGG